MLRVLLKKVTPVVAATLLVMLFCLFDGIYGMTLLDAVTFGFIAIWAYVVLCSLIPMTTYQRRLLTRRYVIYESLYTAALVTFTIAFFTDNFVLSVVMVCVSPLLLCSGFGVFLYCYGKKKLYSSFDASNSVFYVWLKKEVKPKLDTITREEVEDFFYNKTFFYPTRNNLKARLSVFDPILHGDHPTTVSALMSEFPGSDEAIAANTKMAKVVDDFWRDILAKRKKKEEKRR